MYKSFRKWLEGMATPQTGASVANKKAIQNMGDMVGQAINKGQDPKAAVASAVTQAAKTIATNAANANGEGMEDMGAALKGAEAVQKATNNNPNNPNNPNIVQKMKKK